MDRMIHFVVWGFSIQDYNTRFTAFGFGIYVFVGVGGILSIDENILVLLLLPLQTSSNNTSVHLNTISLSYCLPTYLP